jgi:hypothetical protein
MTRDGQARAQAAVPFAVMPKDGTLTARGNPSIPVTRMG